MIVSAKATKLIPPIEMILIGITVIKIETSKEATLIMNHQGE